MDVRTFAGWAVKGLEGAVNILEKVISEDATFTPEFADQLARDTARLVALNEMAQQRVSET